MHNLAMDGLVEWLNGLRGSGQLLEGFNLVRAGDAQPIETRHLPALTIDWDRDLAGPLDGGRQQGARSEERFVLAASAYVSGAAKDGSVERKLRHLWCRVESGQMRGLKAALRLRTRQSLKDLETGIIFMFSLGPTRFGVSKAEGHFTAGCTTELTVTTWGPNP